MVLDGCRLLVEDVFGGDWVSVDEVVLMVVFLDNEWHQHLTCLLLTFYVFKISDFNPSPNLPGDPGE